MRILLLLCMMCVFLRAEEPKVAPLFFERYSGYSFEPSKEVSSKQLQMLFEAAHLSPSSYNEQPWYFIVCDRTRDPESHEKVLSTMVEFNQKWAKEAPVFLIIVAAMRSSYKGKWNRWAQFDTGAAAMSLSLEATYLGLMTHQIGGFDDKKLRRLFSISRENSPMSIMAVGYAASTEIRPERKRKPLEENCFKGTWGEPHQ